MTLDSKNVKGILEIIKQITKVMNKIHFFTVMMVEIFWGHYMTKTLGTLSNKLLNQCFSPFHPPNSIYYSD